MMSAATPIPAITPDPPPPAPRADALTVALDQLRPGDQVLDAGCGEGTHLRRLAAAVGPDGQVIGLDSDLAQLALAAARVADLIDAGRVRLERGTLEELPLPAASIDLAWSAAVFHHLADPPAALAQLRRVVRSGGVIAVHDADLTASFPLLPWPPALEAPLRAAAVRAAAARAAVERAAEHAADRLPEPLDLYVGRQLPGLFHAAGLADLAIHPITELDQAPLAAAREAEIRAWFLGPLASRLEPFLAPHDLAPFRAAFDPADPTYVFAGPAAFMLRLSLVVVGQVPT